jgi:tRNA(Leu) C34 or U34 (ribose-2'-O)-methylase TrmL
MRKLKTSELQRISPEEYQQQRHRKVIVVLDSVRSMNNVGSIFRSSDAFLIDKIYLCGITGKPPHREISKTAIGAEKSVPWEYFPTAMEAIQQLKNDGYTLIAVEQAENSLDLSTAQLPRENVAFIFGNEVDGVAQEVINACDHCLEIPQLGTKHSFNVAVTCGMVLWEHFRQSKLLLLMLVLLSACTSPNNQVSGTKYHVPSTKYQVPSTMYLVPSTMYLVPSTKYHIPYTIFITYSTDCPLCNRYTASIRELVKQLPDSIDFKFLKVNQDEVWDFDWDGNLAEQTINDSNGTWCKKLDLKVYPEVVVLSQSGQKIYQGKIDDRAVETGVSRARAKAEYLKDAINAIKKGVKPSINQTQAVGCYIES